MNQEPTLDARLALRERPTSRSAAMYQSWNELLFLHWSYEPEVVQRTLPDGLSVDTFNGRAYIGIVPFYMRNIRPRYFPPLPGISNFLELNVRTYVYDSFGRPGVWFYSLDCNQWLAVKIARTFFHLNYYFSRMFAATDPATNAVTYSLSRGRDSSYAETRYCYRPVGAEHVAQPGTLEFFLIERYLLFSRKDRQSSLFTGRVYHRPYQLREVEVTEWSGDPISLAGIEAPHREPEHRIYSPGVDVEIFKLEPLIPT